MANIEIGSNLYDIDMERAILSSIFYSEDGFSEISHKINANDFYFPAHKDVYVAMLDCVNHNEPISITFVKKWLGNKYDEKVLSDIADTNSIVDIEKYANELKEKSIKRSLINIAHKIPTLVNENEQSKDVADTISAEIYSLMDEEQIGKIKETPAIIAEVAEEIKKQKEYADRDVIGLDTGFRYLNEFTKGLKPGELIIVAARPGMGKTAFALNMMMKTLEQKRGVVVFSLEMSAVQLMFRILSAKTSIPLSDILTARMSDEYLSDFSAACNEMLDLPLFVYDSGYVNIHQIRTQLRKLKASHQNIDLCVIDYIGLMTSTSNFNERHLQIAEISRGLKLLARELNIPIVALSQLNRGLEARSNKRPMLSDLRESGAIEQDADIILFVYRADFYAEQAEKERQARLIAEGKDPGEPQFEANKVEEKAEIIIGKNRSGEANKTVEVVFQGRYTRFIDSYSNLDDLDDTPLSSSTFVEDGDI